MLLYTIPNSFSFIFIFLCSLFILQVVPDLSNGGRVSGFYPCRDFARYNFCLWRTTSCLLSLSVEFDAFWNFIFQIFLLSGLPQAYLWMVGTCMGLLLVSRGIKGKNEVSNMRAKY